MSPKLPAYVRPHEPSQPANINEQQVSALIRQLKLIPWGGTDGKLFEQITVAAGQTVTIAHTFGRVPTGRIFVRHAGAEVLDGVWTAESVAFVNSTGTNAIISFYLYA